MIHAAITQIASELNQFLKRTYGRSDEMVVVSSLLEQDGSITPHIDNKIVVCLTNIQRDTTMQRMAAASQGSASRVVVGRDPLNLNLYLLFAAYSSGGNYPEALKYISHTLAFFQMNPVLDHATTPDLDPAIDRLVLDIENLDMPALSQLWGILSSRYLPSVMYRVRMVTIDAGAVRSEVSTIGDPRPALGR